MSNHLSSLTTGQLRRAAELKEQIETLNQQLDAIWGTPASSNIPLKKRGISAAGRARMAAAAKARWAKARTVVKPAAKTPATKGGMSASAKAKLSAVAKTRWAKIKAAGKKTL
jgi:hypothetical protein